MARAGQLGAAIVHECATGTRDRRVRPRASSTSPTTRRWRPRWIAREPEVILNCGGVQRRRRRRGSSDRGVERQCAFGVRALARAAPATTRRWSTTAPISCSTATASTPVCRRRIAPNPRSVYAASKLLGEWFALDAPRAYVLRVEEPVRRDAGRRSGEGSVAGILNSAACRRRAEGVRGSHDLADRTSSMWRARRVSCWRRARRPVCTTASTRASLHVARVRAQELARLLGVDAAADAGAAWPTCDLRAERPQYCALSNAKLDRARHRDAYLAGIVETLSTDPRSRGRAQDRRSPATR